MGSTGPIPAWAYGLTCAWCVCVLACLASGAPSGQTISASSLIDMAWTRVSGSATLVPSGRGVRAFGLGLAFEAATVLPFGVASGMLQWPPRRTRPLPVVAKALGKVMLTPGVMEELLFRVLTIDVQRPGFGGRSQTWWNTVVASLLVFSFPYHVDALHHLTAPDVFKDWRFLAMAFLLGVACTYVYIESGSLWLAAATHAVPVWSWLLLLGRPGDLKELTKRL